MNEQNTNPPYRHRLSHGARLQLAVEVIRCSSVPLTKPEIERQAGIIPFNAERWHHFQKKYQDEIVVHPVTGKVYRLGVQNRRVELEIVEAKNEVPTE